MDPIIATPSTYDRVIANAPTGSTVILEAGRYGSIRWRSGVTQHPRGYDPRAPAGLMVTTGDRGHRGKDMPVWFTGPLWNKDQPGAKGYGLHFDNTGHTDLNTFLVTVGMEVRDVSFENQRAARNICLTLRLPPGQVFIANGMRFANIGKNGDVHDHAIYVADTQAGRDGAAAFDIQNVVFWRAGQFPIHLYPQARAGRIAKFVIWQAGGGMVFSSEAGFPDVTRDVHVSQGIMTDKVGAPATQGAYHVSSYQGNATPIRGCSLADTWVGQGLGTPGRVQSGMAGVALRNIMGTTGIQSPGFVDAPNGVMTLRDDSPILAAARAAGLQLGPDGIQPTTPPVPPPAEDPCASLRVQLEAVLADLEQTRVELGDSSRLVAELTGDRDRLAARIQAVRELLAEEGAQGA